MEFQRSLRGGVGVGAGFGKEAGFETRVPRRSHRRMRALPVGEGKIPILPKKRGINPPFPKKRGNKSTLPKKATLENQIKVPAKAGLE